MKIDITDEQKSVLLNEFGISEKDIPMLSKEQWENIREKCFRLAFEEAEYDEDWEYIGTTEKGRIYSSIADLVPSK